MRSSAKCNAEITWREARHGEKKSGREEQAEDGGKREILRAK